MGRKRQKRGSCRQWDSTGTCSFGDSCRFSHSEEPSLAHPQSSGDATPSETQSSSPVPLLGASGRFPKGVPRPLSIEERSFEKYHILDLDKGIHTMLLRHAAGVTLAFLGELHPINRTPEQLKKIVSFEYEDVGGTELTELSVSGKNKKGSVALQPEQTIGRCRVQGQEEDIKIQLGVYGQMIEVNKTLVSEPERIRKDFVVVFKAQGAPANAITHQAFVQLSQQSM